MAEARTAEEGPADVAGPESRVVVQPPVAGDLPGEGGEVLVARERLASPLVGEGAVEVQGDAAVPEGVLQAPGRG